MKAIFIDHMGTIVQENNEYANAVIARAYKNSDAPSLQEAARAWFQIYDNLIEDANGENYRGAYDISMEAFEIFHEKYNLKDDFTQLCGMLEKSWIYAPAFPDTAEFFKKCPLPIYIISNNENRYVEEAMKNLNIHPVGIITSEDARYRKPRKEIFDLALKRSGCLPHEVIHIGDSLKSDVLGAQAAGIEPWLLDRTGEIEVTGIKKFKNLFEVLENIS